MTFLKNSIIISLILVIFIIFPTIANAFYCGHKIVSKHDTAAQVLVKCGEPQARYAWNQTQSRFKNQIRLARSGHVKTTLYQRASENTYDEWIYNFGSYRFLYVLLFKNGRLIKIDTDGYGY